MLEMDELCIKLNNQHIDDHERPEKSPMSLLFYLCQSNEIDLRYEVVEESGPPHYKTFKVKACLGKFEEHFGIGKSIKNAKRDAAQIALINTKLRNKNFVSPNKKQKKHNDTNKISYVQTPRSELNKIAQQRGIIMKVNTTEEEVIEDGESYDLMSINRITIENKSPLSTTVADMNEDRPIAAPDFSKRTNLKITKIYRTTIEFQGQTFSSKARTKQASLHSASIEALNFLHLQSPLPLSPCMYNSPKLLDDYVSRSKLKLNLKCENTNGQDHIPLFKAEYTIYSGEDWKQLNPLRVAEGFGKCKKSAKIEAASNLLELLEKDLENDEKISNST